MNENKIVVGQEVIVRDNNGFHLGYFVTYVSHSGQITVCREMGSRVLYRNFNRDGKEILPRSGSIVRYGSIHFNVEELRERALLCTAARAINAVSGYDRDNEDYSNYMRDENSKKEMESQIVRLEALLAAAKDAVAKI